MGYREALPRQRVSHTERLAERRFAPRAARQLAPRPYRIEPLERIKAEGAITWLMPGRGESGDYLRCSEHKRRSGTTEDCGRTVAG